MIPSTFLVFFSEEKMTKKPRVTIILNEVFDVGCLKARLFKNEWSRLRIRVNQWNKCNKFDWFRSCYTCLTDFIASNLIPNKRCFFLQSCEWWQEWRRRTSKGVLSDDCDRRSSSSRHKWWEVGNRFSASGWSSTYSLSWNPSQKCR